MRYAITALDVVMPKGHFEFESNPLNAVAGYFHISLIHAGSNSLRALPCIMA